MTCFTPVDTNNCFSNVYIREVVRSEIQKASECFEGDSAYAVAVKNGYVGSEDEWLASLGGTITDIKAVSLEAGSAPSANLGGTPRNRIINLGIPKGEKGKEGVQGIPGAIGLSAYDIAVSNGFNGTKTDWLLAIKGVKGDTGPEGPKGEEGKSTYELSVDYGYSGSEREWLSGIVNDTELMSNLNADLISIGEAANGDINTTVVTRTGETYPSAKKAISDGIATLFENGGLPATPFKTKALMTASALENDKYAMVTDDTDNNGLYVKEAGTWVKSEYDSLMKAKDYALDNDSGNYYEELPYGVLGEGYLSTKNEIIASGAMNHSDFIPVTKGDYIVLENIRHSAGTMPNFLLYDASKVFIGALHHASLSNDNLSDETSIMMSGGGVYSSRQNVINIGVIIPSTGYIKVNLVKENQPFINLNVAKLNTKLGKTNFEGFVKKTVFGINESSLKEYKGLIESAVIDTNLFGSSLNINQVVGSPVSINTGTGAGHNLYKRIPVTAGQYFHYQTHCNTVQTTFVVVDANNVVLQTEQKIDEFSSTVSRSLRFFNNIHIKQNGFVLVQQESIAAATGVIYAVTNNKVNINTEYLTNNTQLKFYPTLGAGGFNFSAAYNRRQLSTLGSNVSTANALYTTSVPYVLKRGDVLEYSLEATSSPLLAVVLPRNVVSKGNVDSIGFLLTLIANEVVNESQVTAWIANNKNYAPLFFDKASKGTVAYCNEDTDSVVIFVRPVKGSNTYNTFEQSTKHTLSIYTKAQYIEKRNKELKDRFNIKSAMTPNGTNLNPFFDGAGLGYVSTPSVLLFKGEVLNYLTSSLTRVAATSLNFINGAKVGSEIIENISRLRTFNASSLVMAKKLLVDINNPMSCFKDQIYAHETVIVYPSYYKYEEANHNNLDISNVVSSNFFEPRIVNIEDVVIGDNIEPSFFPAFSSQSAKDPVTGELYVSVATVDNRDTTFSFSPKNSCIEACSWSIRSTIGLQVIKLLPTTALLRNPLMPYAELNPDGETYINIVTWASPHKLGYKLENHSIVSVCSDTKVRDLPTLLSEGSPNVGDVIITNILDNGYPLMQYLYKHDLKSVSEDYYVNNYEVTKEVSLKLPITNNINFNYCNTVGATATPTRTLLQIREGEKVIVVLNVLTENQGQSTARSARRNVNNEFFNSEWEEVFIKFGNEKPEQEMVLKSYLYTDKAHYKETTSTAFWHDIRTAEPFPKGSVITPDVFSDLNEPMNQEARGTTFGFPVVQYRAGQFYSLATARNKKKRDNYAMKSSNRSHILIQADHQAMGVINWSTVQLGNFEVRNPKIKGHVAGDKNLPVGWEDVEGKTNRLIDWMKGCYNNTIDMATTYQDYIDLDSFIDYGIALTVTWNWDGVKNNFLLGTHNSDIWRVFWYDSDQTWGSRGIGDKISYFSMDSGNFFMLLMSKFPALVAKRYARLRRLGVINARDLQDKMLKVSNTHHSAQKTIDALYWGGLAESSGAPYSMAWIDKRINYLDVVYKYEDDYPNLVSQSVFTATTLTSSTPKSYKVTGTRAVVGDTLRIELGEWYANLSVTYLIGSDESVTITLSNTGAEPIVITQTYLRMFKEV